MGRRVELDDNDAGDNQRDAQPAGERQSLAQKVMEQEIRRRKGVYVLAFGIEDMEGVLP